MPDTYFTNDPRFNAYFLNMLRANGNPRRGTALYDQVYGAAASGYGKDAGVQPGGPDAKPVEKPANASFLSMLPGLDGNAGGNDRARSGIPFFNHPLDTGRPDLFPPDAARKNEDFLSGLFDGLKDPRGRNQYALPLIAAGGGAGMAGFDGSGSGLPWAGGVEVPAWLKEQGASPAGGARPGALAYPQDPSQAGSFQGERHVTTAEQAEQQLRKHISEGRYGLVLSILGHSRGRESLSAIGVDVDGIAQEAGEERLRQEQRDADFKQGLYGNQESGNAPASGSELSPTPAYVPGAEPDDFLMHLDYKEELASPAYPSEGGQPRETTEHGREPETGEEVFLKVYRDYLIYKAEHPMMDQIGYKGKEGLALDKLMSRITLANEKDLDAIAELIGIDKNRLVADKNRLAERTGRFSGQTLNAAPAISPVPGPDSASADEFLNRVKQEIPQYLQQLGALSASGQYSAANREEVLAEYTGLSRLMMMGKDDPYAQFYAEELKPYGYDPVNGFSTLEENARRVGTAIYAIDQGQQALLRPFFNQVEKRLRSDPDTAVQYIKDNAEKIRMAGLDPDALAGDVADQVSDYKKMADPAIELSWISSQADDGSEGYVSNFIISKSTDPSGQFVIMQVNNPATFPFTSQYYVLSYIDENGTARITEVYGTLGYAQFIANKYKRNLQEGELFKSLNNSPSAYMEYIKTIPQDQAMTEAQAIGLAKGSDIRRWLTQGVNDLLGLLKSAWANALIAASNALSHKEVKWIPNAGWKEWDQTFVANTGHDPETSWSARLEKSWAGRQAGAGIEMISDPLFWLMGGFGIRAGLRAKAAATPGTMENSWARLGVGYSRDFKGLVKRLSGGAPDDVLYSRYATPYGKLPDEAFGIYNEGADSLVDGFKVIDGKIGGKIPVDEFKAIRQSSIKNLEADSITFGKYTNGPDCYIKRAGANSSYFDLGDEWGRIQKQYNLSDREMFDYFNAPAIKDAIASGKTIKFSHNPLDYKGGALVEEWEYIKNLLDLEDKNLVKIGDFWYVQR